MECIAIIGMGCRFPEAENPQAFWSLLWNGVDAVTEVPADRWDRERFYDPEPGRLGKTITRCAGFLRQVDAFDNEFFGIDAREARRLDPQQRLMLEVAWEAIEDAALHPQGLAGTRTGVFVGVRQTDFNRYLYGELERIDGKNPDSTYPCIIANRISYLLDLRGPSIAVDTACSSSLVSAHLACQSLRTGESDLALAGGINLNLFPEELISRSLAGMVSPSGRCRAFDARADGYVFGEGCGVVVLKRLQDALRDDDNILAVIRGAATNHNGLSYKLTAYNGLSQQALLRTALEGAGVRAEDVGLIEANGTGSYLGDPIELKAIRSVLGEPATSGARRCWVGSVKTNIGHLEGAAGIASLIKVVLSLQHEGIPPHLHLRELNPGISLDGTRLAIPVTPQPWPRSAQKRLAGVSAFGLGGANVHMVLEEAPEAPPRTGHTDRAQHILALSAPSEGALRELATRYLRLLDRHADSSIADLCFTANTSRSQFRHRLAIVAGSAAALRDALVAWESPGRRSDRVVTAKAGRKQPKIAMVFSAVGAGFPIGVGRELYETQLAFRAAVDRCEGILRPGPQRSIGQMLTELPRLEGGLEASAPVVFSLWYAWAQVWRTWGVIPAICIGEGIGEKVAACVSGACRLEDALASMAVVESARAEDLCAPQGCQPGPSTEAIERAVQESCSVVLQFGHDSLMFPQGQDGETLTWLACGGQPDWFRWLRNLGEMYVRGVAVDWVAFDRDYGRRRIQAPTYPFQRQRFALERGSPGPEKPVPLGESEVDRLIDGLLGEGDAERLVPLRADSSPSPMREALRRQVRSLGMEQASNLLAGALRLSREKDDLLKDGRDRVLLRRRVAGLDAAQARDLLVSAVELLWKKDELVNAYLEERFGQAEAHGRNLEQTRLALVYMSELLRRKNWRLDVQDSST